MSAWQQAVDGLKQCLDAGIREYVVCSGARNALLLESIARAEAAGIVRVWRHFEERSAGFFALGRTMETLEPCAVVTTSGTAAAELLPAVIEARYQMRPLVAITADRPQRFRSSGAPQAIDQLGLYGGYAANGSAAEWDGCGPWHFNLELDESSEMGPDDFKDLVVGSFRANQTKLNVARLARWLREDLYLGLVVMVGGLDPEEREEVFHFCRSLNVPLVVDATSGLREAFPNQLIHHPDRVLKSRPPGKILRLGDVPTCRFWRDLEDLPNVSVWSVCRSGLPGLARDSDVIHGALDRVLPALGDVEPADDALDLLVGESARVARVDELLECYPDSEPALVRAISQYASIGSGVFLGNSLPIREWNLFAQSVRPVTNVRANRGANGIDGQISTWLGWTADLSDAWSVIGDLTALYDLAAGFMSGQVESRGRVLVVINNQGGGIFERLPRLQSMSPRAREWMINSHKADLSALASLWGMNHLRVRSLDDMDRFEVSESAVLLEVMPDAGQTARFWQEFDHIG